MGIAIPAVVVVVAATAIAVPSPLPSRLLEVPHEVELVLSRGHPNTMNSAVEDILTEYAVHVVTAGLVLSLDRIFSLDRNLRSTFNVFDEVYMDAVEVSDLLREHVVNLVHPFRSSCSVCDCRDLVHHGIVSVSRHLRPSVDVPSG